MVIADGVDASRRDVLITSPEEREDRTVRTAELPGDVRPVEGGRAGHIEVRERGPVADRAPEAEAGDADPRRAEITEPLEGRGQVGVDLIGGQCPDERGEVRRFAA